MALGLDQCGGKFTSCVTAGMYLEKPSQLVIPAFAGMTSWINGLYEIPRYFN
jgi:hypothetical protein